MQRLSHPGLDFSAAHRCRLPRRVAPLRYKRGGVAKWICAATLGLVLFSSFLAAPLAQLSRPTEDQVKAAYLYNFAKFVEWPPATFSSPNDPILICSIGDDRTGEALQQAVMGKRANGRRVEAKNIGLLRESKSCHILFIGFHEKGQVAEILRGVQDASVLTVCESLHFIKLGGMINLVRNGSSIELEINPEAAQAAGLKISSRLLVVSRVVTAAGRGGQP